MPSSSPLGSILPLKSLRRLALPAFIAGAFLAGNVVVQAQATADPSTIAGKVLVGYQGWFRCPGDGSPGNNWSHWTNGYVAPTSSTISVINYPDTTQLPSISQCAVPGMTTEQGQQGYLFSSFYKQTVEAHFAWMREFGIDGALVQRFTVEIPNQLAENETTLKNEMTAAQDNGRVFAVEYDLSRGDYSTMTNAQVLSQIETDWLHLVNDLGVTSSPAYLHQGGKPLVSIWGFGFNDTNHIEDPQLASQIITWFQQTAGVTVMGGTPRAWGTPGTADSNGAAGWAATYAQLNIVQPWTVGAYGDIDDANGYMTQYLVPDMALTAKNNQLYMPVIFPGGSASVHRLGGTFYWQQAYNTRSVGAPMVKIAMFDEVNEGTALFKVASLRSEAPNWPNWITLDADGDTLPSDWYMRLGYETQRIYHGEIANTETMPSTPWLTTAFNCGVLQSNQSLGPNQPLQSCDGRLELLLQSDGNLVVYQGSTPLWASGTAGQSVSIVYMQGDGNLVEYSPSGAPVWASNTAGQSGAFLRLQDDGNLTIVNTTGIIWSSGS